jgi:hypothetical protein
MSRRKLPFWFALWFVPCGLAGPLSATSTANLNLTVFADQQGGADPCARIANAFRLLPPTGGIVNATGFSDSYLAANPCSVNPFAGVSTTGQLLLRGTFQTKVPWVIPNKVSVLGTGRGDPGWHNTAIQAIPGFPANAALVSLGRIAPSFGVRVENLTVDCNQIAGCTGVQNFNAEEESGLRHVNITNYLAIGLDIETSNAQNSGPYEDIELLPAPSASAETLGFSVQSVVSFRGIHGVTINDSGAAIAPANCADVDSSGTFMDIHIEGCGVGVLIGSNAAVSGASFFNIFGATTGTVTTVAEISNAYSSQDILFSGLERGAGTNVLIDQITGAVLTDNSLSFYLVGDGVGATKTRLSSSAGLNNLFAAPVVVTGTQSLSSNCSLTAQAGGAASGTFRSVASGVCTIVVNLPAAPNGWACKASDLSNPAAAVAQILPLTATSCTMAGATNAGDVITWSAVPY